MSRRIANVSHLIKDVSDCIVIVSDAYGGLRLRIKDVGHHTANVSDAYGGLRLRIANVIPIYAIYTTAPSPY